MTNECVFCKIASGEIPVEKIYENKNFFSFPDANPQTKGHSLIISKKHFNNVLDLPEILGKDLIDCIKNTSITLMKKYNATGFNIINNNFESAGQLVKHFHIHIIPRKKDDGLKIL
jgi:histidine triad (HIT) family protein